MVKSRIPRIRGNSREEVFAWFSTLHKRGLLFCLDNDPRELFKISDDSRLFTNEEAAEISTILHALFVRHGDVLHELAFEVVSRTFHTRAERRAFKIMYG
ncbi:hypothetical protein [Thiobacillus sp.]|uniref:hypothetical protein n=1 Tax=Thiobacillus sp. TaxID=924 RepID=UPI0025FEC40C|nr:hypothetical protein [Thiobacillus sp.]